MIKITKKLIKEIIKLDNPTDEDYKILWKFIYTYYLEPSEDYNTNKLISLTLKKYNRKFLKVIND